MPSGPQFLNKRDARRVRLITGEENFSELGEVTERKLKLCANSSPILADGGRPTCVLCQLALPCTIDSTVPSGKPKRSSQAWRDV